MTDANTQAPRADQSARDADKTDEQLWDDIERQEKDAGPADDHDEGKAPDFEAAAGADDPEPQPSDDDDPIPSEDDGEGDDGASPVGMDREALQAQNKRLQHSLDSEKGRSAKGRRVIDDLNMQIAAAKASQRDNPDDDHLKERREQVKAAREEYGEVIGPLTDTITDLEARVAQLSAHEEKELGRLEERHKALVDAELEVFKSEHPDGLDAINKHREVFDEWIEDQPKALRDIYAENQQFIVDGTQAALLVGLFKQALLDADGGSTPANHETERLQHRRQRQLAGAHSIRSTNRQQASSRPARDSDDAQAHWDYYARLDRER